MSPRKLAATVASPGLATIQGRPVFESIADWRQKNARRLAESPAGLCAQRGRRPPPRPLFPRSRTDPPAAPRVAATLGIKPRPAAASRRSNSSRRDRDAGRGERFRTARRLRGDARTRGLPLEFHLIGSTDRDASLLRLGNVQITGRYREPDVYDLIAAAKPHLAFLPSECPESFMYTLSIAMAARLVRHLLRPGRPGRARAGMGLGPTDRP